MVRVPMDRAAVYGGGVALGFILFAVGVARADAPPAHELAERFAADAERTERKAAERAEQQRLRKLEAERQRDESDMLARARAEASERQAELERQRIARELAEKLAEEEAQLIAEAKRAEEARRQAESAARAEAEKRAAVERERAADAERLSEVLRQAAEVHERRRQERHAESAPSSPPAADRDVQTTAAVPSPALPAAVPETVREQTPVRPDGAGGESDRRFAVLLVMEPGNRGIRRHNKTADPVLCVDDGCYVSNGPEAAAALLPRNKALGFGRTWGARAGACQNSLGCVFRGVEARSLPFHVQPVDMRVIRHDRREMQSVSAGSDCFVVAGRLTCRRPVRSHDYVMWLVPERLAEKLGPAYLDKALADGLADSEQAELRNSTSR